MQFPNKEQETVIRHSGRPLLVIAGPGTGKTITLVARMVKLITENPNRDVSFITFTRTSRRDTNNRVGEEVGKKAFEEAEFEFPRVSTLHTYAKSLIHKYATLIKRHPNFSILIDEKGEKDLLLLELIKDLKLKIDLQRLRQEIYCYRCTGTWRRGCRLPESKRAEVLEHFELLLRFYNTLEMEGLIPVAYEILSNSETELPPAYLQVDEYQDLNPMDQKLIELASSSKGSQVVVVGDDAQSIYKFRYAKLEGIRELYESDRWDKIQFSCSHRLPPHIMRASHALIAGKGYLGANIIPPEDDGRRIFTLQCTKSDLQIVAVARLMKDLLKKRRRKNGDQLQYRDLMVLCPNRMFVKKVTTSLANECGIPTKQVEKTSIPEYEWRLLLVLRMVGSGDSLALRQWLSIAGVKVSEIEVFRKKAMEAGQTLYEYCSGAKEPTVKGIFEHLRKVKASTSSTKELRKQLEKFPGLKVPVSLFDELGITVGKATEEPPNVWGLIKAIHEKYGVLDRGEDSPDEDKVLVATMYSAKGLEADFVFVTWLNDTFLPGRGRDPEEERRVLYVSLTRAKQDVILSFHERYDGKQLLKKEAMSPFLREIREHLKIRRVRKAHVT